MGVSINTTKSLGRSVGTSITPPKASAFTNVDSLLLDGAIGQYAKSNAVYTTLNGATNVSFSMWLKPISGGATLRMVFQIGRGSTGLNSQCQLFLYEGNRIDFSINSSGPYGRGNISTLTYGSWNHLVVAVDLTHGSNPECQMFLNGADVTINDNMGTTHSFPTATDELYVGETKTGHYNPFNGNIDEFAIYNGTTLTLAQAQAIYNQGGTAKPGDLSILSPAPTLWYRMGDSDGGSGTTLTDAAGSADATLINSASYTTDVP